MSKDVKTYTVTRIENGFVEASSLKKAKKIAKKQGFVVTYSSEHVNKETDSDKKFWRNLDVNKIKELKELLKTQETQDD